MISLVLFSEPGQVGIMRCLVRATLEYRGLGHYASEAEVVASELVTNAIQHASDADPDAKIGVTLVHVRDKEALSVVVTDSSSRPDGLELFIYDDGRVKVGKWNASAVVDQVLNYGPGKSEPRPNAWIQARFTDTSS